MLFSNLSINDQNRNGNGTFGTHPLVICSLLFANVFFYVVAEQPNKGLCLIFIFPYFEIDHGEN